MAPLRIGLTGGIGSGKSTVAAMLADRGAVVIDTDAIARSLTLPGGVAIPTLRAEFGAAFITADGALDRPLMRELAFAQPDARRRLEAILHPLIRDEAERRAAASDANVHVFDVPLLTESATWAARVDRVLVIDCSPKTQIARVVDRSGWSRAAVESVMAQQATREQRLAVADDVIVNDGIDLTQLSNRVDQVWAVWLNARLKQAVKVRQANSSQ